MIRKGTARRNKQNNAGSAIVTVLVVVAFMTILATIMLYVSGSNFQMKVADYRTKESFYYAETPVEELREKLIEDVQEAFAKAYTSVVAEYTGFGAVENAEYNYRHLFCEEMNKIWAERNRDVDGNQTWECGIGKVVQQPPSAIGGEWVLTGVPATDKFDDSKVFDSGWLIMDGVEFTYYSKEGYTSIISTDFCITIPKVQWPVLNTTTNTYKYGNTADERLNFSACVGYMNWTKN